MSRRRSSMHGNGCAAPAESLQAEDRLDDQAGQLLDAEDEVRHSRSSTCRTRTSPTGLLFPWPLGSTMTHWPEPLGRRPEVDQRDRERSRITAAGAKTSAFVGVCGFDVRGFDAGSLDDRTADHDGDDVERLAGRRDRANGHERVIDPRLVDREIANVAAPPTVPSDGLRTASPSSRAPAGFP